MPFLLIQRYFIIVGIDEVDRANREAARIDPAPRGDQTFGSVKLAPSDAETCSAECQSHTACNTLVLLNGGSASKILEAYESFDTAEIYRVQTKNTNGQVEKYSGGNWSDIGQGNISDLALLDAGLQRI